MINYFNPKNVILLIIVLISSFFYQYIKELFLKSLKLDPNMSTSLNLYNFYIGYTNYNVLKYIISIISYILYNTLKNRI